MADIDIATPNYIIKYNLNAKYNYITVQSTKDQYIILIKN